MTSILLSVASLLLESSQPSSKPIQDLLMMYLDLADEVDFELENRYTFLNINILFLFLFY